MTISVCLDQYNKCGSLRYFSQGNLQLSSGHLEWVKFSAYLNNKILLWPHLPKFLLLVDSLSSHPLSYAEDRPSDRGRQTRLVLSAVSIEDVEVFACVFCSQIILLDLGFIFISSSSVEAANSLSAFFRTDHVMVMHCLPLFIIWCMDLFVFDCVKCVSSENNQCFEYFLEHQR